MAVATRDLDRTLAAMLARYKISLTDGGVDRENIDTALEYHRAEAAAWREEHLAELRGWLERDGQSLN